MNVMMSGQLAVLLYLPTASLLLVFSDCCFHVLTFTGAFCGHSVSPRKDRRLLHNEAIMIP